MKNDGILCNKILDNNCVLQENKKESTPWSQRSGEAAVAEIVQVLWDWKESQNEARKDLYNHVL